MNLNNVLWAAIPALLAVLAPVAVADTGVDFISVGALTHSARAVDLGLDFAG